MSGPYVQPLVYSFGQGRAEGTSAMKDILGGKGAGLADPEDDACDRAVELE